MSGINPKLQRIICERLYISIMNFLVFNKVIRKIIKAFKNVSHSIQQTGQIIE